MEEFSILERKVKDLLNRYESILAEHRALTENISFLNKVKLELEAKINSFKEEKTILETDKRNIIDNLNNLKEERDNLFKQLEAARIEKDNFKKFKQEFEEYAEKYPEEYKEYKNAIEGNYHLDITELQKEFKPGYTEATRNISHRIIQEVAAQNPTFLSGTADLSSSTKTSIQGEGRFSCENYTGRNVYFGIREFAMVSIMNGMTLHKGVKISAGGFLVFSDYFKAALRMGSLQECPIILPLSHDSIAVGEDGPTHQPVEQLAMLRSSIDVEVLRPADANEMLASWKIAVETKNMPVALILTRQPVENLTNSTYEDVLHGAYIARKESGDLEGIIIASGSEVGLAIHAQEELEKQGHSVRVVSMPSMNLFDAQTDEYKESVLPNSCRKRLSVEMLSDFGWHKYVGLDGKTMCVDTFGASAPASRVIKEYGFTVENVVKEYNSL